MAFGPYDYGMNNSDTTSPASSVSSKGRRDGHYGIPIRCCIPGCGGKIVIQTEITGLNAGRRFYTCERNEDGCRIRHTRRWWDDAMMDEFQDIKAEMGLLEDRIGYITYDGNGDNVDPQMMWNNVLYSWDQMLPLLRSCDEELKKLKDTVLNLELADNDFNTLHGMVMNLHDRVFGQNDMIVTLMIGVLVGVVSVVIFFCFLFV